MEQNGGFGAGVWGMVEVIDVAVRTQATKDPGTGWHINREALGADGHLAVIADAHVDALTPDKWPPRAVGDGTQDRAVFGAGVRCWTGGLIFAETSNPPSAGLAKFRRIDHPWPRS